MKPAILVKLSLLFFAFIPSFVLSQSQKESKLTLSFPQASQFANSKFTYKIIPAPENTFGYDILCDGKILIHQPSIPGMPGTKAFRSKMDAVKVASLIIFKIKKGEMPPSITTEELKKLNVL